MRTLPTILMLSLVLPIVACNKEDQTVSANTVKTMPVSVDVATPLKHNIIDWDDFVGRFEAIDNVDIRARVTGYLMQKKFKDGQFVKKGDVLFVIDPRPFQFEVERTRAQYKLAKKEYERAKGLRDSRAISEEEVDRRFQEMQVSQAVLSDAELQVQFTEVTAPIDGKISDGFVDVGNLVTGNETVLTRIVSVDPIHFRFEGSQGQLLKYTRMDRAGKRPSSDSNANPIFIKLLDEDKFYHLGRMEFVDNVVDTSTGTIQARAVVNNKDAIIYPGLFGRARLLGSAEYEAILLPEKAINTDQSKKFVYVVGADNKVGRSYVTLGPVLDNELIVVTKGLNGNERVIVNGVQRIRGSDQIVSPTNIDLVWEEIDSMIGNSKDELLASDVSYKGTNPSPSTKNNK